MLIHQIFNNNVAVTLDKENREKIIMGKGICYKKKVGDYIDPNVIEKEFILFDDDIREKFKTIATEVNSQCLNIAENIIRKATEILDVKLNENIYVSLTDHIQFAINRYHHGLQLKNDMLWYIKRMHPKEYEIGKEGLDLIEKEFGIRLLDDESSSIALHIISAEMNEDIPQVINITKMAKDIESIVVNHFNINLNESSIDYFRFITHLKFLAKRITNSMTYNDSNNKDDPLYEAIKSSYPDAFKCSQRISIYLKNNWNHNLSNDELIYLTIHIKRLILKD